MNDVQIIISHDGTGTVGFGDQVATVSGTDANEARRSAIALVSERAQELGQALPATAHEGGRSWPLLIAPDGTVAARTQATEPISEAPGITELEDAQEDLEDTRVRPVATPPQPISPETSSWAQDAPAEPTEAVQSIDKAPLAPAVQSADVELESNVPQPPEVITEAPAAVAPAAPQPDLVETDPRWAERAQQPATHGLRGTVNGLGLKLAATEAELLERRETLRQEILAEEQERVAATERARDEEVQESRRAAREREAAQKDKAEREIIQTNHETPKTVLVANQKGGVGKTTAIYCLAATAGRIRGGDVVAWDANETQGTLGFRARKDRHDRSVVDFLEEAAPDFTTVEGSKRSTLTRYTRVQGDNQFSVFASDESSERQDLVDGAAYGTVHEILSRFFTLIFIDTGNNHRVDHFKAALASTDQLVIPISAGADGVHAAETVLDNFIGLGYGDLVKNAIVLLNDSSTRRGDAHNVLAKFENRVRTIIPVPFDPALDHGGEIDFEALQPATRAAYQSAAAAISHGLADTKEL